jgi:hypothetical protein
MGAKGTNIATGQPNQPTTQNDPDSLKLTPGGALMLSSGDDGQLIFVLNPGSGDQRVAFLSLLTPANAHVSGLDDAIFPFQAPIPGRFILPIRVIIAFSRSKSMTLRRVRFTPA